LEKTQRFPEDGALAVIVLPPVEIPSSIPPDATATKITDDQPPLPLSVLCKGYKGPSPLGIELGRHVPLYNAVPLFPSLEMRSQLLEGLKRVTIVERRARWREGAKIIREGKSPREGKEKKKKKDNPSDAFLLKGDAQTVRRADTVPLAIALWRLRMWEGQGWEKELESQAGWATKEVAFPPLE